MRPQILYYYFTPIDSLPGIGAKTKKRIEKICGNKIIDIVWHKPRTIIDRSYSPTIKNAKAGTIATLRGKVISYHPAPKYSKLPFKIKVEEEGEKIVLIFFKANENYLKLQFPIDKRVIFSGKINEYNSNKQITHPEFYEIEKKPNQIPSFPLIEPVYSLSKGIAKQTYLKTLNKILSEMPSMPEWIDQNTLKNNNWPSWNEAIIKLHNPENINDVYDGKNNSSIGGAHLERLSYDEIFANQLIISIVRNSNKKKGRVIKGNGKIVEKIIKNLPYELTSCQKNAYIEIRDNMHVEEPMSRMLQGDVGSGKTIVALLSMINAAECRVQSAIMAPTEILAKQHYKNIKELLIDTDIECVFLTGKIKLKKRKEILAEIKNGKALIIIGTHALFQNDVKYKDLGLVIMDEQHRFGVEQRIAFLNKGNNPDFLVMTATPIPRSIMLSNYGDLKRTEIISKPKERKEIITKAMNKNKINGLMGRLKKIIEKGEQIYWVCPLIEESEKTSLTNVLERSTVLKSIYGEKNVGIVHSKMKEDDKDNVINDFLNNKIKILVATTVIEVGVDVKNANTIIIENANRFGLSQLHQLRGRVGRSNKQAYCIMIYDDNSTSIAIERLKVIRNCSNGFEIAEKDLMLRGAGDILGTKQAGLPDFKVANIKAFCKYTQIAQKNVNKLLEKDPMLRSKEGEIIKTVLYLFEKEKTFMNLQSG